MPHPAKWPVCPCVKTHWRGQQFLLLNRSFFAITFHTCFGWQNTSGSQYIWTKEIWGTTPVKKNALIPETCDLLNQKVHAITCSYFYLNICSVVLCNISVNQQSFIKSKWSQAILQHCCPQVRFKATENREWSLRRSCAGRHGVKYQQNGADRRIELFFCDVFLLQEFITFIILNYFVLPNFYYKYTK
jgi:hypothetical protein